MAIRYILLTKTTLKILFETDKFVLKIPSRMSQINITKFFESVKL